MPYDFQLIRAVEFIAFKVWQELSHDHDLTIKLKQLPEENMLAINLEHHPEWSRLNISYTTSQGEPQNVGFTVQQDSPFNYAEWLSIVIDSIIDAITSEQNGDIDFNHVSTVIWRNQNGELIKNENKRSSHHSTQSEEQAPQLETIFETIQDLAEAHDEFIYTPPTGFDEDDWNLDEISPLKLLGYTVGNNNGMHTDRRRSFLLTFWIVHLPATVREPRRSAWGNPTTQARLEKMISHIKSNIFRSNNNPSHAKAVADWKEDVMFLEAILLQSNMDNDIPF